MSNPLIDTLNGITEMVTTACYYINSDEAKKLLHDDRDQLIDNITNLLARFQKQGFHYNDVKALVTELVSRKETDDHGWFIDIDASTHEQVVFTHPQRKAPSQTLVLTKSHALLPFNLLA